MPDPLVLEKAAALAKLPRNVANTPFTRDSDTGALYYADIEGREQTLLAVKEIYEGDFFAHIDPYQGETLAEAQQKPGRLWLDYMRSWIARRNTTYELEPERRFYFKGKRLENEDKFVELISEAYRKMNVNAALCRTEREMEVYGNVVLRTLYDDEFMEPVLDTYISPRVRVVDNQRNPRRPYATVLTGSILERNRQMRATKLDVADAYITPTPKQPGLFGEYGAGRSGEWEPLKTIKPPLVHCFDEDPTTDTGYYIPPLGLVLAKLAVAVNGEWLAGFGYTIQMQAHGQMVILGHDGSTPIELGPGRAIRFDGRADANQDVRYVASNADLMGFQNAVQMVLKEIREVYGIPASELDVGDEASGRSRIEARAPNAAVRKAKQKKMRAIETELLRSTIMTLSASDPTWPRGLNADDYDVALVYAEPQVTLAIQDQIAKEQHELTIGLTNPGQLLMLRNPDAFDSAEEAQEVVDENLAMNEKLMPKPEPMPGDMPMDKQKSEMPVDKPE